MDSNVIGDISRNFESALGNFYEGAAQGISSYVIPIAWVLFGICMLIWCYLIIEGKIASPMTDWFLRFVGFMLILYVMGSGYLSWVAQPIFNLPSELTTAMSGSTSSATDLLGQVNEKVTNLVSVMFAAASNLMRDLAIGPSIALFLMGVLVVIATYLLLAAALFSVIFAKLGLSLVLAVGPFFLLALVLNQTRSYFFSWLSTALYFVFYQVFSGLFIFMFIGIINSYLGRLNVALGGAAVGDGSIMLMAARMIGASGDGFNVAAVTTPILLISLSMFFMFLQIPMICTSLTGGSGGALSGGLAGLHQARGIFRSRRSK